MGRITLPASVRAECDQCHRFSGWPEHEGERAVPPEGWLILQVETTVRLDLCSWGCLAAFVAGRLQEHDANDHVSL